MLVSSIVKELKSPYEGYSLSALLVYGWGVIAITIICALLISKRPWKNKNIDTSWEEQ